MPKAIKSLPMFFTMLFAVGSFSMRSVFLVYHIVFKMMDDDIVKGAAGSFAFGVAVALAFAGAYYFIKKSYWLLGTSLVYVAASLIHWIYMVVVVPFVSVFTIPHWGSRCSVFFVVGLVMFGLHFALRAFEPTHRLLLKISGEE